MSIAAQLEAHLRDRVQRNLERTRTVLVELIKAPINSVSGQLAAGIVVDAWSDNGDRFSSSARSLAPYSLYVDSGTGEFGPNGGRIYPTSKKALHFYWQNRGEWVTFKSVRGSPAQNYFHQPMPDNFSNALQIAWGP